MAKGRRYQVSELAHLSGVSVRALHHYDEIGLLVPSNRSRAGYRLYTDEDLLRLQQIVIGRELGMPLEAIRRSLDDPNFDRLTALEQQRRELATRAERTLQMLQAIDTAIAELEGRKPMQEMSDQERAALFDGFDPSKCEAEVKQRWGERNAYAESARRTRQYTKADWERYKAEMHAILKAAADLFRAGVSPDDGAAMEVAERHRLSIDRWFYPCPTEVHSGLADLYEADARFAENIDQHGAGLTRWWSQAIRANSKR